MSEKKVDEDWKRRAQVEREQDAAKSGLEPPGPGKPSAPEGEGPAPEDTGQNNPAFSGLVESLASQALLFMGAVADPMSGQTHRDLNQSQAMIDLLSMLQDKTKGNLTAKEAEHLEQILGDVRLAYVRLSAPPPPPPQGAVPQPGH